MSPRLASLGGVVLVLLLMLSWLSTSAQAQSIAAAGDGQDMWVVLPESSKGLTILHRSAADAQGHFWKVTTLPGLLAPGGTAAGHNRLWMVYNTMMVQSMRLESDPQTPWSRYSRARFLTSLPQDITLRSLAGSESTLWALVDVTTPAALKELEQPDNSLGSSNSDDDSVLIIPNDSAATQTAAVTQPATATPPDNQPATQPTTASPATTPFEKPVARLVSHQRGPWKVMALPEDWPQGQRAWVIVPHNDAAFPTLIVEPNGQEARTLRVYHYHNNTWQSTTYTTPSDIGEVVFLTIQQQLVMAAREPDEANMHVSLWVLRPERKQIVSVGQIAIDQPTTSNWGIAPDGLSATLLMQNGAKTPVAASINLQGLITHSPKDIVIEQPPQFVQNPGQILLVGVVAISIFLMFIIWRRDPNLDDVTLPKNKMLADFGRRLGAAAIDMVPCIFVAMLVTGVDFSKFQHDWPGRSGSWMSMIPGFIAIGLYVLHTGLTELFTGKTLGKAICGIEVISTTGGPPNIWQVLARNLLKAFDLIAFYILPVLALVGKHRQRLGDLVGKTLVVMPTAPPPPGEIDEKSKHADSEHSDDKSGSDASSDGVTKDDASEDDASKDSTQK